MKLFLRKLVAGIALLLILLLQYATAEELQRYPLPADISPIVENFDHPGPEIEPDPYPQFQDLPSLNATAHFAVDAVVIQGSVESTRLTAWQEVAVSKAGTSYFDQRTSESFPSVTSLQLPTVCPIFAQPANRGIGGQDLLQPYRNRTANYRLTNDMVSGPDLQSIPSGFAPWWFSLVANSIGPPSNKFTVSLDALIQGALRYSPHVQVAATEPHILQTNVVEEAAQFDWKSFLESKYKDTNDPIGNSLTTGNNDDRFTEQEWSGSGGFRRRNTRGGEIEISQRLAYLDNNSQFLIPPDQGSSRLELNYRQPLLKGRGQAVNESLIVLADIDFHKASDEFLEQLQSHLTDVTETYWELVRARSDYFQRQKLLQGAEQILLNLQGRSEVDALDRQILRAQAAVANRRAEIARSLTSIKNAQSRLRLLVNEPSLVDTIGKEFLPADLPNHEQIPIDLADALSTAIANRPDISRAIRDLKTSQVRLGVAKNEILPKLDLLIGTYVAGLDDSSNAVNSWVNQFRDGRPGFHVGFEYELPVGNRAALAREQRRQWEITRSLQQFSAIVETGLNDVELAVREVRTSYKEMTGRYHAIVAAANETSFLIDRWKILPGFDDSVTLLLEDLLDSQERLADEEAAYSKAQFEYAVATVNLKRAMGTLFIVHPQVHP